APAKVAALTEGVLQAMFVAKLKSALAWVVVVGLVALGVGTLGRPALARMFQPDVPAAIQDKKEPKKKQLDQKQPDRKQPQKKEQKKPALKRARAEEMVVKSFTTKGAPRLVVQTFNGAVTVTTGAAGKVEARVIKSVRAESEEAAREDLKNVEVQMSQDGDTVRITAKA